MNAFIHENVAAHLPENFSIRAIPPMLLGWYRPRHQLIWGEVRRIGQRALAGSKPSSPQPEPRRRLRFAASSEQFLPAVESAPVDA